jgi:hypothetical protein
MVYGISIILYLWIQPYLLRKWDWGMIWGVVRIFSGSVWIHRDKVGIPKMEKSGKTWM